jgi:hypothetical protein
VINLVAALMIILKHATSLRALSLSPASALKYAELDYQEANIDLKIQEHLMASSQQVSVQQFSAFVMATDIGWSIFASAKITFIKVFSIVPVHNQQTQHTGT